jgi:pyrroline-5-carboxylate reductase
MGVFLCYHNDFRFYWNWQNSFISYHWYLQFKNKYKQIIISPRNKKISLTLKKKFKKVIISKTNQEIVDKSNWVFLSVTPTVGEKIIKDLKFKKNQKVISFISTITLSQLKKMIKEKVDIVRAIPLPPISLKEGPIPYMST